MLATETNYWLQKLIILIIIQKLIIQLYKIITTESLICSLFHFGTLSLPIFVPCFYPQQRYNEVNQRTADLY